MAGRKKKVSTKVANKKPVKKSTTKRTKKTTSKDVPGNGLAKKAAKAIEARHKLLRSI